MLRDVKAGATKGRKRSKSAARSRSPLSGSPELLQSSDEDGSGATRSPAKVGKKMTARGKAAAAKTHPSMATLANGVGAAKSPLASARFPVPLKKTAVSAVAAAAVSGPSSLPAGLYAVCLSRLFFCSTCTPYMMAACKLCSFIAVKAVTCRRCGAPAECLLSQLNLVSGRGLHRWKLALTHGPRDS